MPIYKLYHKIAGILRNPWIPLFLLCLAIIFAPTVYALNQENTTVAIIVSMKIKPYMEAVEGISDELEKYPEFSKKIFFLPDMEQNDDGKDFYEMLKGFSCHIAVGPEAARFLWKKKEKGFPNKVFSMVLNPEMEFDSPDAACGISLNIDVQMQLKMVNEVVPPIKRIGMLFDPANNRKKVDQIKKIAEQNGIKISTVEIYSQKEIYAALLPLWNNIDALWLLPDRTVISESVVQYIIKEAISHGVGVIGYNRFFYDNGAFLCFIFDYKEIGRQTAEKLIDVLNGRECKYLQPAFQVWINMKVIKNIGINPMLNQNAGVVRGP